MANIDNTTSQSNQPLAPVQQAGFLFEKTVDFSGTGNAMAASDTMDLFDLPSGLLVMGCKVEVLTAEGSAVTADLGLTGGNVDEYIDGVNLNATGVTMSGDAATPEPVSLSNNGKYLSAAETVSLLAIGGGLSNAKIRVQIFGFDLRSRLADPA